MITDLADFVDFLLNVGKIFSGAGNFLDGLSSLSSFSA